MVYGDGDGMWIEDEDVDGHGDGRGLWDSEGGCELFGFFGCVDWGEPRNPLCCSGLWAFLIPSFFY